MSDNWYYADSEGAVGPFSLQELKGTLATVPDAQRVLVWCEGLPDWVRAGDLPFFRETATPAPLRNTQSTSQMKWWWYVSALLSFGTIASREGYQRMARASGETSRTMEIVRRGQRTTVKPAHFEKWATFGFFIGAVNGVSQLRYSWEGDGIRLNLIELFSMGVGFGMIGIVMAALWNWAGKIS